VCWPNVIAAQNLADRVLVVYNAGLPESRSVAEYYLARRHIPRSNLCPIGPFEDPAPSTAISWDRFDTIIRVPIQQCVNAVGRDRILYIVFAFGTPFRLSHMPDAAGHALDSYIGDLWNEFGASPAPVVNPYRARIAARPNVYPTFISLASYRASPHARRIYSVWRLDAATTVLARSLVDKALAAERRGVRGRACIDRRYGSMPDIQDSGYGAGDWSLFRAAEFLRAARIQVIEEDSAAEFGAAPAPLRCDGAIFYAGWYSLNRYNDVFTWKSGAIGIHLDSLSALNPRTGSNWAANALQRGITITSGAVDEPGLEALPRPDGIVHDLLAGANVGDAFLRNTAALKWMVINIGDPLFRWRPLPRPGSRH
jgi:uncharacterized protein (TIGR03790 family)